MAMRTMSAVVAIALLAGCGRMPTVSPSHHDGGRYEGIGIATPGDAWTKAATPAPVRLTEHKTAEADGSAVSSGLDSEPIGK